MTSPKTLCLIDGSGFIFRAFYALPPLTRSDGTPVGAVFGFTSMLMNLIETHKHDLWAVIFDAKRQNFRHAIYPEYKANRSSPPEELIPQFPLIREVCKVFDVPSIEQEGFEADDLIATYAKQAEADGYKVTIVSGDKDLMQLMSPNIELIDPIKNRALTLEDVHKKFGVTPEKVADVQALMGDTSDNIPGVPGIGPKTAAELITTYQNLETLLRNTHTIKQAKRKELLQTNAHMAEMSKQLVLLKPDVPVHTPYTELKPQPMQPEKILQFIADNGFSRLKSRALSLLQPTSREEIAQTNTPQQQATFTCITTLNALKTVTAEILKTGLVAVDTETDGLNSFECNLVGISLCWNPTSAVYIPIHHKDAEGTPLSNQLTIAEVASVLSPIFQSSAILKIGHNIKFDAEVLTRHTLPINNTLTDTMVMSYTLDMGNHGHGLDELALKYFNHQNIPYKQAIASAPKTGRKDPTFDFVPLDVATTYAAEDAWITFLLYNTLNQRLIHEKATHLYHSLDKPLIDVLINMESNGVKLDIPYLQQLTQQFENTCKQLEVQIFQLAGHSFNLGSPKQLSEVLFEHLNLPTDQKKGKAGHYSTDSDILETLANQGYKIAEFILTWRQLNKLITTYTKSLPEKVNPTTQRVHTNFGLTITTTGRLSSSEPNLQNIPIRTQEGKQIRNAFIAKTGHKIVSFDYSQIELRLLAHIANISELKEAFQHNQDIHTLTAAHVLNVETQNVTPEQRRSAKAINFGIIYGISAFGLSNQLGVSKSQAQSYIEAYFQRYPGIKSYMDNTIHQARTQGYVTTLLGHKAYIKGINDRNYSIRNYAERQAINAPIQGSNADIIKKAMIEIYAQIQQKNIDAQLVLQVHDELVFEIPDHAIETAVPRIKHIMENTVKLTTPIIVDFGISTSWAGTH